MSVRIDADRKKLQPVYLGLHLGHTRGGEQKSSELFVFLKQPKFLLQQNLTEPRFQAWLQFKCQGKSFTSILCRVGCWILQILSSYIGHLSAFYSIHTKWKMTT